MEANSERNVTQIEKQFHVLNSWSFSMLCENSVLATKNKWVRKVSRMSCY